MLQRAGLIAPTYLTICGVAPGEGCVLSRDREGSEDGSCVEARLTDGELPRLCTPCNQSMEARLMVFWWPSLTLAFENSRLIR